MCVLISEFFIFLKNGGVARIQVGGIYTSMIKSNQGKDTSKQLPFTCGVMERNEMSGEDTV